MKRLLYLVFCLIILSPALPETGANAQKKDHRAKKTKQRRSDPAGFQSPNSPELQASRKIHADIFADPFDEDKLTAYKEILPKDGQYFVVEGDLLLTEDELRVYVVGRSAAPVPAQHDGELILARYGGLDNVYLTERDRKLTYAVDRRSFPTNEQYALVRDNMRIATQRWESVCPECKIDFQHVTALDETSPAPSETLNFVVRHRDARGAYIAAAFFPYYAMSRRYLNIDPTYFTASFDKAGILRHELGHVIGYRHEHIRDLPGCYQYRERNTEWRPLSLYDPRSVMHYICGGGGTRTLELTDVDIKSHRDLYNGTYKLR